jgi:type IV secretion system protein VirD4
MLIIRPEEVRQLPERQVLVVAENTRPIIARLTRCIDGRPGRQLLAQQRDARTRILRETRTRPAAESARVAVAVSELGGQP